MVKLCDLSRAFCTSEIELLQTSVFRAYPSNGDIEADDDDDDKRQ
jgi:hypothetical protein